MKEKLDQIKTEALNKIENSTSLENLNEVRVNYLGKKGELTAVLKSMKDVAPEDRPKVGQLVNETREEIENVLENAKKKISSISSASSIRFCFSSSNIPISPKYSSYGIARLFSSSCFCIAISVYQQLISFFNLILKSLLFNHIINLLVKHIEIRLR